MWKRIRIGPGSPKSRAEMLDNTLRRVRVRGVGVGGLIVHRDWRRNCRVFWSVTHRGTGMYLANLLTRARAMKLARQLQGLDWDFATPEDVPASTVIAVRRILREFAGQVAHGPDCCCTGCWQDRPATSQREQEVPHA